MASNPNMMAPAKLAEFRYGREEMLALFTMPGEKALPGFQERVVANAGLLAEKPSWPMNLMGPMSEEEQRAWQKGANSDTSLRLYKKELPPGSLGGGGPGVGRGAGGERGRGRGRGFFDRHRSQVDEEDPGRREDGGRAFGRGIYCLTRKIRQIEAFRTFLFIFDDFPNFSKTLQYTENEFFA